MVLKTFSVQQATFEKFSRFCKDYGMSMSKQIELFMESVVEEEPEARKEYLKKLDKIKKGKFTRYSSIDKFEQKLGL